MELLAEYEDADDLNRDYPGINCPLCDDAGCDECPPARVVLAAYIATLTVGE